MDNELKHYGTPRHSGRYPWGSGEDGYQRSSNFRSHVRELRKQGLSELEIARGEGMKVHELRKRISLEKAEDRAAATAQVIRMKNLGYSNMEIGRRMNLNESSVRSLLDPVLKERNEITKATSNMLKESVDKKQFIDIGVGVETNVGISRTKLNTAVAALKEQGYEVHTVKVPQVGMPGQFTVMKVLAVPTDDPKQQWKSLVKDFSKIQSLDYATEDYGRSFVQNKPLSPPKSVDAKRVMIKYAEDGGNQKDGVMELRRGVEDLDLGNSKYAQVRIAVNDTHYLKGMAIYGDNLPDGVDIVFNTNKTKDVPMLGPKDNSVLKPLKDDAENPFGATIKEGGRRGAINIVNEEGDWDKWSKTISSQVLSKQTVPLAKQQLDLALKQKKEEYDEIQKLTNPVVKKELMMSFADDCDSSAVHLKAAALPRQASKVILPVPGLKDTEVYAPSYNDGEVVVLIRHPHGGRFEIPQLTVNNRSRAAKAIMNQAQDAVGINPNVAKKLSGADFDGDTVIVIPNNRGLVKTAASLKGLKDFDPIESYRIPEGSSIKPIKPKTKQTKMGEVSNLITDMTIKGANMDEIARAVRHSMVVIDSEKHNLDYRQSYKDNGIAELSAKYQNSKRGGASTLISKASSAIDIPERIARRAQDGGPIDKLTGEKVYVPTNSTYKEVVTTIDPVSGKKTYTPTGKIITRTQKSTRMAETDDARTLSSGRAIEEVYASYANELKALGNTARREALHTKPIPYNPSAKRVYEHEVSTLNSRLNIALKNKPLERQAQILANSEVTRKKQANPNMDKDDLKKVKNQALAKARVRTGADKQLIRPTEKEWAAIQAGAISPTKLTMILKNADLDVIKQLATPRASTTMSATQLTKARTMLKSGNTQAEVAESLGISVSTLNKGIGIG